MMENLIVVVGTLVVYVCWPTCRQMLMHVITSVPNSWLPRDSYNALSRFRVVDTAWDRVPRRALPLDRQKGQRKSNRITQVLWLIH